jgi:hypothetical protein
VICGEKLPKWMSLLYSQLVMRKCRHEKDWENLSLVLKAEGNVTVCDTPTNWRKSSSRVEEVVVPKIDKELEKKRMGC